MCCSLHFRNTTEIHDIKSMSVHTEEPRLKSKRDKDVKEITNHQRAQILMPYISLNVTLQRGGQAEIKC